MRAEPRTGRATPHGTTILAPPEISSRARPVIAGRPRGTNDTRATSVAVRRSPGASRTTPGRGAPETPAIPSTAAETVTTTRRDETLRRTSRRLERQPAPATVPKET